MRSHYKTARREYNSLTQILNLLQHEELPPAGRMIGTDAYRKDLYHYILFNILQLFMKQDYMKIQFSEQKYKLRALHLQALQHQINPHFMNNTLNGIYWEAIRLGHGKNSCSSMVEKLSSIMEYAMDSSQELTTVESEINYLHSYLDIQNQRYGGKVEMLWRIDERALSFPVPRMLFQPMIRKLKTISASIIPIRGEDPLWPRFRHPFLQQAGARDHRALQDSLTDPADLFLSPCLNFADQIALISAPQKYR